MKDLKINKSKYVTWMLRADDISNINIIIDNKEFILKYCNNNNSNVFFVQKDYSHTKHFMYDSNIKILTKNEISILLSPKIVNSIFEEMIETRIEFIERYFYVFILKNQEKKHIRNATFSFIDVEAKYDFSKYKEMWKAK